MDPGGRSFVANDGEDFVLGVRTQLLDELKLNKGTLVSKLKIEWILERRFLWNR
jgi:hypothetical protein